MPPTGLQREPRFGTRTFRSSTIEADRPCGSCGYNLKGLTPGGVCPECGAPIRARVSSNEATPELLEAPRWLVLSIGWGCFGLIGVVVAKQLMAGVLWLFKASPVWIHASHACFGVAWLIAVTLVTLPRPGRPEMKWMENVEFVSRWSARLLAIAVPGVHLLLLGMMFAQAANARAAALAGAPVFNGAPWETAVFITQGVYFVSFLPLAWTLSNLAVSCAESAVTWRARSVIACFLWTFLMYGLLLVSGPGGWVFGLIGTLTWGIGWIILLVSTGHVGSMMLWAVKYNDSAAEREQRRLERERRERDRFPAPAPVSPIGPAPSRATRPAPGRPRI